MKLLVTGATGFLGRRVVADALRRGHTVRAMVRPGFDGEPFGPGVDIVRGDLRDTRHLDLGAADAVLHLAAAKTGDLYAQMHATVAGTENLIAAMRAAKLNRMVLVSSLSVYDYAALAPWASLDESSPLESQPQHRDAYCQAKLWQERVVREATDMQWTVLRPGPIVGPQHAWTSRLGVQLSKRWWLLVGCMAPLPLVHVDSCARAVVLAAERSAVARETFNVVDDAPPTQWRYARRIAPTGTHTIVVPRLAAGAIAHAASAVNQRFFGGDARVPGLFIPRRLAARCKPLRYPNDHLKRSLDWHSTPATPRFAAPIPRTALT
jgi:nucleoside-diphosphate-sugar epimerase